ncbi:hypothetical protein Dcar01_02406 [Deinococcus carri]|uniref:Uncharacterized protein n=1 Tax=Deinococcus carri TaxID=1211323 RepID=A0ABP9W8I5_9DEIO
MGQITRRSPGADLSPLDARLDALEGTTYSSRTLSSDYWPEYAIRADENVWTRLQRGGASAPPLQVPPLPLARPGHKWEAQIEGFLRLRTTKRGTVYVGIQLNGAGMGSVSGGKLFTEGGDDLLPIMQRLPVNGGETIYFSVYSQAAGGDTLTIIPNPYPYLLVREVVA